MRLSPSARLAIARTARPMAAATRAYRRRLRAFTRPSFQPIVKGVSIGTMLEALITPRSRDIGDGFMVRRALPAAERRMVGPFVFFDQMGPVAFHPNQGLTVRPHPHI